MPTVTHDLEFRILTANIRLRSCLKQKSRRAANCMLSRAVLAPWVDSAALSSCSRQPQQRFLRQRHLRAEDDSIRKFESAFEFDYFYLFDHYLAYLTYLSFFPLKGITP